MKGDGFINLLKPPLMTSHDVVLKARAILKEKRIGHLGTLDPDAAGVLPVAIGLATRLVEFFAQERKTYRAQLILGSTTDTQDSSGKVVAEKRVPVLTKGTLEKVLQMFRGELSQIPPMVSALSYGGKRLYQYAREGIEVPREARPITIYALQLVRFYPGEPYEIVLDIECSGGTYIRTLCHDIGELLGCGGHMGWLIRTKHGPFRLETTVTLEDLTAGNNQNFVTSMFDGLEPFAAVEVPPERHSALQNGLSQYLPDNGWLPEQWVRLHYCRQLLAMGQVVKQGERWVCRPKKVFQPKQMQK
ncbi:MAG: tRNA pseudouridine(55) synthase TruB [Heliobacteriaceae bacterium]|nr:tRNA pseudouridine(55) synthase TruB [Heliobacteriaceae bacterium]MDD4588423.1 tRNA pseudouridine(55) synthase TruB [Heliobacteriaceae bacterium]